MTTKFKKGDWVRVTDNSGAPRYFKVGDVFKVSKVERDLVRREDDAGMYSKRFEPWTPKVGERVRMVRAVDGHKAECGATVVSKESINSERPWIIEFDEEREWAHNSYGKTKHCRGWWVSTADIEPLPVAAEAQPAAPAAPEQLTIRAGRFYKTRDGRKVGPMRQERWFWNADGGANGMPWHFTDSGISAFNGILPRDEQRKKHDLIAEWPADTTASGTTTNVAATVDAINEEYGPVVSAKPKFKVGDVAVGKSGNRYKLVDNSDNKFWPLRSEGFHFTAHFWKEDGRAWDGKDGHEDLVSVVPSAPSIVCKLTNGQPLPANCPRVHTSTDEANEEAKRLASVNKGQEFGVFTLGETHKVEKTYEHEWQRLAAGGETIKATKELRKQAGLHLATAAIAVNDWINRAA